MAAINKWTEDDRLNHVRQCLKNAARAWYRSLWFEDRPQDWQEFEREFRTAFLRDNASDSLRARLRKLKQTRDMDVMEYYFKTMELCAMIDKKMSERERIDQVIDNLLPEVRPTIRMRDPQTVIELQRAIKLWAADHPHVKEGQDTSKVKKPQGQDNRTRPTNNNRNGRQLRTREENWCLNCGKKGHYIREYLLMKML